MKLQELHDFKSTVDKVKHFFNAKISTKDLVDGAEFRVHKDTADGRSIEFVLQILDASEPNLDIKYAIDDGSPRYKDANSILDILNYSKSVEKIKWI